MTDAKTDTDVQGALRDGVDTAVDKASQAYEAARVRAAEAVEISRDKAREAARQAAKTIDGNPMGVIVGGLALGALVAAIIPRSQREKELLAPVGRRIGATAAAAVTAAKEAGRAELQEIGISRGAAKDQAKSLFAGIARAATTAGSAAARAGKEAARS